MNKWTRKSKRKIDRLRTEKNSTSVFFDEENNVLWRIESDSAGYRLFKEISEVIRV